MDDLKLRFKISAVLDIRVPPEFIAKRLNIQKLENRKKILFGILNEGSRQTPRILSLKFVNSLEQKSISRSDCMSFIQNHPPKLVIK